MDQITDQSSKLHTSPLKKQKAVSINTNSLLIETVFIGINFLNYDDKISIGIYMMHLLIQLAIIRDVAFELFYFIKLRELIQNGSIGELISIQHFEPIEHIHMSHSYVRGNWHNSKATTPIILAKSCHDLDILRWMVGKSCEKISAFGDLSWFKKENMPKGATPRCVDGCTIEKECPYSALKIYYKDRQRTHVFDLPEDESKHGDAILDRLKTTNYGRCVYQMDNDQPDHYTTNLQFSNGVTAALVWKLLLLTKEDVPV